MIDKNKVKQRFSRAKESYSKQAVAQQRICQHLVALMQTYMQTPCVKVFEIGCGSGNLTRLMLEKYQPNTYIANDIYAEVSQFFTWTDQLQFCIGDIEHIDYPKNIDAVVSSSALQWVHDFPQVLDKIHDALTAKGWLAFSSFSEQNLQEIKALTGYGLDYMSAEMMREMLEQHGFDVLQIETQTITLWFRHPLQVLKHLKATGVTASQSHFVWSKQKLQQFYDDYKQFSQTDREHQQQYALTYHPIYVIARKK